MVLKDDEGYTIDSVNYKNVLPWPVTGEDYSIELTHILSDNSVGNNWEESLESMGSAGIPAFNNAVYELKINEFLADNDNYVADEYNEYNDWIEILNTSNETIDIGGLFITNNLSLADLCQIPTDNPEVTRLRPGEYLLFWADNDAMQGSCHLPFKLDADGGDIGLSIDGENIFESVSYTQQDEDDSYGRYTDGLDSWVVFKKPTPGKENSYPPEFLSEPDTIVTKGEGYAYNIEIQDEEGDELILGIYQKPRWLNLSQGTNESGLLQGTTPTYDFSPVHVTLFVTDGITRPVTQEFVLMRDTALEIIDEPFALKQVKTYPNPTRGVIHVEAVSDSEMIQVSISTLTGRIIYSDEIVNISGTIQKTYDLSGAGKGIYFIRFKTDEGIFTHKLVVQ